MNEQSEKILSNSVKLYVRVHELKPKSSNSHRDIMRALDRLPYLVQWHDICELFEKYYNIPTNNLW